MVIELKRLYEILNECTVQLRKGPEMIETQVGPLTVVEIDMNSSVEAARPDLEKIDFEMLVVGVDKEAATKNRKEFVSILADMNQEMLASGPSYIAMGAEIGDQGAAFQLFALGNTLGLWDIMTPAILGATGEQARQLAGMGYIMMSPYQP